MSAFQVSKGHIDRLVALALWGPHECPRHGWDPIWWSSGNRASSQRTVRVDNTDDVGRC